MRLLIKLICIICLTFDMYGVSPAVVYNYEGLKENGYLSDAKSDSLIFKMNLAQKITWERFYHPKTHLFYDYLSSYDPSKGLSHLPKPEEVLEQYPNNCGYDTGMEDSMISAGVLLDMILDQYEVTNNNKLRKDAYKVFKGIKLCATVHGVPGFLARSVCVVDGKSIYINSSRDQYTHAVFGLWRYYNSELCNPRIQKEIGTILASFADRMIINVTPENKFDFLTARGTIDSRGITRMWNVNGHEAARLPMIYAAAWHTTGNKKYFDMYIKYLNPAIEQSMEIREEIVPTYSLIQMQSSMILLRELEADKGRLKKIDDIMLMVSKIGAKRAIQANSLASQLDLTMVGSDWRTGEGLNSKGEYRKVWYNIRESGEAALAQLMCEKDNFNEEQKVLLSQAIQRLDYNRVSSNGIFYLLGAYWKARKQNLF